MAWYFGGVVLLTRVASRGDVRDALTAVLVEVGVVPGNEHQSTDLKLGEQELGCLVTFLDLVGDDA